MISILNIGLNQEQYTLRDANLMKVISDWETGWYLDGGFLKHGPKELESIATWAPSSLVIHDNVLGIHQVISHRQGAGDMTLDYITGYWFSSVPLTEVSWPDQVDNVQGEYCPELVTLLTVCHCWALHPDLDSLLKNLHRAGSRYEVIRPFPIKDMIQLAKLVGQPRVFSQPLTSLGNGEDKIDQVIDDVLNEEDLHILGLQEREYITFEEFVREVYLAK